jgi:hypothetical protein
MSKHLFSAVLAVLLSAAGCSDGDADSTSCPKPFVTCADACVDPRVDPAHCGGCDRPCAAGEVCSDGACLLSCPAGTEKCGDRCVDTRVDPGNCGACGNACGEDLVCKEGACACPGGLESCDGECVDTRTDAAHCGGCGEACGENAVCVEGVCACPHGLDACLGGCFDLASDRDHCGACDTACPVDLICRAGACAPTPCGEIGLPGRHAVDAGVPVGAYGVGDVDGDGDPDLVFGPFDTDTALRWIENDGGRMTVRGTVAVPGQLLWGEVKVVDLDGEAPVDLVAATDRAEGGVAVVAILRDAGGVRLEELAWPEGDGRGPVKSPVLGDLDGDGDRDLVVIGYDEPAPRLAENRGDGTFEPLEARFPIPAGVYPSVLEVADVDGDGLEDLVAVGGFRLYSLRNARGFEFVADEALAYPGSGSVLNLADFDGDGDLDALVDGAFLAANDGAGRFSIFPEEPPVLGPTWRSVAGDLDGDGDPDFAQVELGSLSVVRNQTDGLHLDLPRAVGYRVDRLFLEDMDGDDKLDLVMGNPGLPWIDILANPGDGRFPVPFRLFGAGGLPATAVGDVDGGGLDLLLVPGDQRSLYKMTFSNENPAVGMVTVDDVYRGVQLLQLDRDPAPEFVTTRPSSGHVVAFDGWPPVVLEEVEVGASLAGVVAADLDGDGVEELVTLENGVLPGLRVLWGGTFLPSVLLELEGGAVPGEGAAIDLDGDGDDEVLVGTGAGVRRLDFREGRLVELPGFGDFEAAFAAGDLDNDARPDVVVAAVDGPLRVYRGTGEDFEPPIEVPGDGAWQLAIADVDGDGWGDVAAIDHFGDLLLYRGTAGGLVREGRWPGVAAAVGPGGRPALSLVDLDGDLRPDPFLADGYSSVLVKATCLVP